jgi:hypothetical protein
MVDLSKIRRRAPAPAPAPAPAGMRAPPRPASDFDLPAPARPGPPAQARAPLPPAPLASAPAPASRPSAPARPAALPMPEPAPMPRGMGPARPLRLPETGGGPKEGERGVHGSPPVFIKIDKYSDIVKNLQKLKSYAMSLRDALDALSDIEKEITTGISIAHKALDDFNTIIAILDSKLLKASAIEDMDIGAPGDVDKYIKGIYDQMEKIKTELKEMS